MLHPLGLYEDYMAVSLDRGTQHRSQYTLILVIGTTDTVSLILGTPDSSNESFTPLAVGGKRNLALKASGFVGFGFRVRVKGLGILGLVHRTGV